MGLNPFLIEPRVTHTVDCILVGRNVRDQSLKRTLQTNKSAINKGIT